MANSTDTPLMRQYLEIKARYSDAILFFQLGDFYEMFFDDAVVASEILELALTSRDKNKEDPVPMCGIPQHAASGYVRKLLDNGFKVAICDQVEDPKEAKGIVRREVTQLVTPGVVLDTNHLEAKHNNYLVVITVDKKKDGNPTNMFGLAALDLSTCELRLTQIEDASNALDELARLGAKEIIYPIHAKEHLEKVIDGNAWHVGPTGVFQDFKTDKALIEKHCEDPHILKTLDQMPIAVSAAASALRYANTTQPQKNVPICRLIPYCSSEYLQIDETTLINLEIFESLMERKRSGSLLSILDHTKTAMGGRFLRRMLAMPLLDVAAIRRRQDAVEFLVEQADLRRQLRDSLREVHDLERLTSRTVLEVVTPRELVRLGTSLERLPILFDLLQGMAKSKIMLAGDLPELLKWPDDTLDDVAQKIISALVEDPPPHAKEGGLFRKGYNFELDELIDLCEGGKSDISAIEARERVRTGINSLKVRYNRVFGYYIEVTKANLNNVPDDYYRKQTLANAERFVTPELADYEAKVLGAQEKRNALEQKLFQALREQIALEAGRLKEAALRVALLDFLCSLAEVAQLNDYVRPEVDDSLVIELVDARHPVVERFMPQGQFVPNDVCLDTQKNRMLVLTGPNMSGKSTVMRQVCLITLMAQMGSFVPCRRARIGVVDRIFTRVGASDNLARGESTFMVEMRETAAILRNASSRSLVVLDEIGRGTATYDGISIAWAVGETLHDRVCARCMFATHYHELCWLAEVKPHVSNFTIDVKNWRGKVIFLRKLVPGGSNRSYGIEVARLAGLDPEVVKRAGQVLKALELGEHVEGVPLRGRTSDGASNQLSFFGGASAGPLRSLENSSELESIKQELLTLDINAMSPIDALNLLALFVERVREKDKKW